MSAVMTMRMATNDGGVDIRTEFFAMDGNNHGNDMMMMTSKAKLPPMMRTLATMM